MKLSEIVVECINSRCMTEHMNVISYKLLIQVEIEILVGRYTVMFTKLGRVFTETVS